MTEIKNLKKTAQRILKAIKKKEKIILYGDADLDGISSVIILKETVNNLGGEVSAVYFPDRESEGYGITETALDSLKGLSPGLLITFDCGISSFKEASLAKKMGFEVIIVDHHEILDRLPEASIIVDPKQKGDKYPFKVLSTTGIAYKLSVLLLGDKLTDSLKKSFLELVALATLADMMPEVGENKTMIEEGLSDLKNTWRPGLRPFFEIKELADSEKPRAVAQKITSALNIVETKDHLPGTYLLLTISSVSEARAMVQNLLFKREQKQREIKEITWQIEERISKKMNDEIVIFEGDSSWSLSLLGSAASRICREFQKPTFLYKKMDEESRGAVRPPAGINGVEAMKKCSKYLLSYGGHPQAAGFYIKNENLEGFKECLIDYLK